MSITSNQLSKIAPNLSEPKLSMWCSHINEAMVLFHITTPEAEAMFIAQTMHESGECRYTKELASGQAYEARKDLGNTIPGDGVRYKGRGLIQITGRANYKRISDACGVDFVAHPELLETPDWAAASAAWFWSINKLNDIAQLNTDDSFLKVTKRINGGTNGLEDRRKYWIRAKQQLGVA
jgi:putative chitinase